MAETKHTPTKGPWTVEEPTKGCAAYLIHGGTTWDELAAVTREADARLICLAVNSHDELLEACKEARNVLVMAIRANVTGIGFDPAEHLTVKKLDAAIAKAGR